MERGASRDQEQENGCDAGHRHALAGRATAMTEAQPITIDSNGFGGEAQFHGSIAAIDGCIVTRNGNSTVLFDRGVTLLPTGDGVFDPATGNSIRFGARITGGAAILRDAGRGWSIREIERFYGVTIPPACPKHDVTRLHHLEPVQE
ncbi:hypothetical protein [Croceicoccus sp. YJ47]|uniref:hypothetical protein n=1 Tax=Croceicoccus sp. YJ47 TaxID=2798724 RepID=UPI001920C7BA|nr:hypothetical protein [Croceicoccus sp. YJ47]QQN74372.1 hypothetical protein JD971_00765 [Croceicoccus sp. YJ47]